MQNRVRKLFGFPFLIYNNIFPTKILCSVDFAQVFLPETIATDYCCMKGLPSKLTYGQNKDGTFVLIYFKFYSSLSNIIYQRLYYTKDKI